jgi:peptide subunit release factor 1 (eRF1)
VTDEGKEKKVNIDFEPFKPINTSLYLCDNKVGGCHAMCTHEAV